MIAGEDLVEPWGSSWLWVLAVLGPVVGARTLLKQDEPRPSVSLTKHRTSTAAG